MYHNKNRTGRLLWSINKFSSHEELWNQFSVCIQDRYRVSCKTRHLFEADYLVASMIPSPVPGGWWNLMFCKPTEPNKSRHCFSLRSRAATWTIIMTLIHADARSQPESGRMCSWMISREYPGFIASTIWVKIERQCSSDQSWRIQCIKYARAPCKHSLDWFTGVI